MIDPSLYNDNHEYVETAFPLKLHVVLDEAEKRGFSDVISWQGNKAFMIHKPKKFQDSIMSEYFNQTEYKSFQKQRKFHFLSEATSMFELALLLRFSKTEIFIQHLKVFLFPKMNSSVVHVIFRSYQSETPRFHTICGR